MVNPWWLLSAPAAVVGGATVFRRGGGGSGGDVKARRVAAGEGEFVCERVCASNKLLNKVRGWRWRGASRACAEFTRLQPRSAIWAIGYTRGCSALRRARFDRNES